MGYRVPILRKALDATALRLLTRIVAVHAHAKKRVRRLFHVRRGGMGLARLMSTSHQRLKAATRQH